MSSGVSDQMKVPGNTAKHVEERNIPWSQQVDEASYENLASPSTDDNFVANSSSMQFQYPPFNLRDNHSMSFNNYKSRKPSVNTETNKKYGKPSFYNAKRDDFQPNAWGSHNTRRIISDNNSGNFNRSNRSEFGNTTGKLDNRQSGADSVEEKRPTAGSINPPVAAPKKTTWASIASQPAKLASRTTLSISSHKKKGPGMPPPPMVPGKHNLDVNTWDLPNNNPPPVPSPPPTIDVSYSDIIADLSSSTGTASEQEHHKSSSSEKGQKELDFSKDENKVNYNTNNLGRVRNSPNGHSRKNWSVPHASHQNRQISGTSGSLRRVESGNSGQNRYNERRGHFSSGRYEQQDNKSNFRDEENSRNAENTLNTAEAAGESPQAVLDELRDKNNYNPVELDLEKAASARFFVIKSYSEDDIHRSIKYEIWCSTDHGNKRLDEAFRERHKDGGNILLFFSVNGSGHFCGMAQMMTEVDYNSTSSVWSQDKWKGKFKVKWIYVKDVPNGKLRHIRLENNENKSVTNSRDTQEVPNAKGIEVLKVLHLYKNTTSIFDDFYHYEKKQEEEVSSKKPLTHDNMNISQFQPSINRHYSGKTDDRDRDRDRDRDGRNSGTQKYFISSNNSGTNFRDRNNTHRGGYLSNYNDYRRFESHRTTSINDIHQKDSRDRDIDADRDRESGEYGSRHIQKFDYDRRHNNREREFNEDHNKSESRFRAGPRESLKDNENQTADRIRSSDY